MKGENNMSKFRVSYTSFAGDYPKHGSKIVHASTAREAMDILENEHPEFSTTCAKQVK